MGTKEGRELRATRKTREEGLRAKEKKGEEPESKKRKRLEKRIRACFSVAILLPLSFSLMQRILSDALQFALLATLLNGEGHEHKGQN